MENVQPYQPSDHPDPHTPVLLHEAKRQPARDNSTTIAGDNWTLKEKLAIGIAALALAGGLGWVIDKVILRKISNNEELKTFSEGTPATIAKKIKMAFENDGWWGTDQEALRAALISVPSQEDWSKVLKSYEKLYSLPGKPASLLRDMSDELQTSEYTEMMQIITTKPLKPGGAVPYLSQYRAWAKRLKAAFDKTYGFLPGTDSQAVTTTLTEIPTQQALINTGIEYKKMFGTNLMNDLKGEGEFGQYEEWVKIIASKKKK